MAPGGDTKKGAGAYPVGKQTLGTRLTVKLLTRHANKPLPKPLAKSLGWYLTKRLPAKYPFPQ